MQFVEKPRSGPSINITSLIDVLFLLLTFFLVTTTFIEQSALKVVLPSMEHSDTVSSEREFVLEVGETGVMRYEGVELDRSILSSILKGAHEEINAGGGLTLRADRSLTHGDVMGILDLIKEAGVRRFIIATVRAAQ